MGTNAMQISGKMSEKFIMPGEWSLSLCMTSLCAAFYIS